MRSVHWLASLLLLFPFDRAHPQGDEIPREANALEASEVLSRSHYRNFRPAPLSAEQRQRLASIVREYPAPLRQALLQEVKILFVSGENGSRGEYLQLSSGIPIIILNERLFTDPNFFNGRLRLGFELTSGQESEYQWLSGENSADIGLSFVLLHELGHHLDRTSFTEQERRSFSELSWEGHLPREPWAQSIATALYSIPRGAAYAGNAKLGVASLCTLYEALPHTSFVSLYALADTGEDLADTLAIFVWTQVMNREWQVSLPQQCQSRIESPASRAENGNSPLGAKWAWMREWMAQFTASNEL
jgi:hypothetical protein